MSKLGKAFSKRVLEEATLKVLSQSTTAMSAQEINDKVASELKIPQEILEIEDASLTSTEYTYQMRWIRTKLKKEGKILNPERGKWEHA